MEFTAKQISDLIQGEILGNENELITGVSPIESGTPGHLSFIGQDAFLSYLDDTQCSVLIVSKKFLSERVYKPTIIAVEDAYLSFQILMNMYQEMISGKKEGIEEHSYIAPTSKIEKKVYVGAFSYISDEVHIGEGTQIFPHVFLGKGVKLGKNCQVDSGVKIYDGCIVGDNCVIHANTVIGGDGFGFQPTQDGFKKIPQLGNVVLENDVEIGSNCSIDRATIGSTIIGKGTKIDNLIQIAHNVKIGKNNVIAAQAGIAGSTIIGDWNQIGGQTGIIGHIRIGNQVKIQAQSGVNNHVDDHEVLYGSPAIPASNFRRNYVYFRNLTSIVERLQELENIIKK